MRILHTSRPRCQFSDSWLRYPLRLKNCTARSCLSAAARVLKVPRFRRLPVFGSFLSEYRRYRPSGNFRIMTAALRFCSSLLT